MPVKLIPKSEMAGLKAKQSAREIQEGVKIATRIDGLRSLWAKTEQDYETYKIAALSAIQGEIDGLSGKKEELTAELRQMQAKYDSLMTDISFKRSELAQSEKKLASWEKTLEKREEDAALSELDVKEASDAAKDALKSAEANERMSVRILADADSRKSAAEDALATAKTVREKAYADKKDIEESLGLRELSIIAKEQSMSKKEAQLAVTEKELNDAKVAVNDMRETLLRSMARLKEGRRA